jgi:hypothetical protein
MPHFYLHYSASWVRPEYRNPAGGVRSCPATSHGPGDFAGHPVEQDPADHRRPTARNPDADLMSDRTAI